MSPQFASQNVPRKIYIDLGRDEWEAVEIDAEGWRIVPDPPVKFIRPQGLRALPEPVPGGSVDELRKFINVASEDDFKLVVAWLVMALSPRGPYPILVLIAEQGAGKSTAQRVLRRLIDPNKAEIRTAPRDERDLLIAAQNGWIVSLDNISYLRPNLSDALCRIATGSGFATRRLYTDTTETLIEVCRPQILNGIPDFATRPDFVDRAVAPRIPRIESTERKLEGDFWQDFKAAAPGILGFLFDAVACALNGLQDIKARAKSENWSLPRMADFALWVEAAAPALGWESGEFLRAYERNRTASIETSVEADHVALAVLDLAEDIEAGKFANDPNEWSGTATDLLKELSGRVGDDVTRSRQWPKTPGHLSGRLRQAAPGLRRFGIEFDLDGREGHDRKRVKKIRTRPRNGVRSGLPSAADANALYKGDFEADAEADTTSTSVAGSVRNNPLKNKGEDAADAADASLRSSSKPSRTPFEPNKLLSTPVTAYWNPKTGQWIEPSGSNRSRVVGGVPEDDQPYEEEL